jgi:hypothetical protein
MANNSEFEPFLENFPLPQPSGGMTRRRDESRPGDVSSHFSQRPLRMQIFLALFL